MRALVFFEWSKINKLSWVVLYTDVEILLWNNDQKQVSCHMMAELGGNVTTYIRLVLDKETDGQTGPHTAVQVSLYNTKLSVSVWSHLSYPTDPLTTLSWLIRADSSKFEQKFSGLLACLLLDSGLCQGARDLAGGGGSLDLGLRPLLSQVEEAQSAGELPGVHAGHWEPGQGHFTVG